jgi:hypothetical protein
VLDRKDNQPRRHASTHGSKKRERNRRRKDADDSQRLIKTAPGNTEWVRGKGGVVWGTSRTGAG